MPTSNITSTSCCVCKADIYMPDTWLSYFRSSQIVFHCINGHRQSFSKEPSEAALLRKKLNAEQLARQRAEQMVAQKEDEIREAQQQAAHERKRANGYKGHATHITKQAKAGICPCCNRTFVALARHMATQHPKFTPLEELDPPNK